MNGPDRVVAHARSMLGVRWRHQGRKPWAVDCLGLVVLSLAAAGWKGAVCVPARYGTEPWDDQLRKGLEAHFGAPVVQGQAGDVALVRWGRSEPSHVAILADYVWGGLSAIHAHNRHGVIETALSGEIKDSVEAIYRPDWSVA
jgi:cell wall-associated NlpC family hydrolase